MHLPLSSVEPAGLGAVSSSRWCGGLVWVYMGGRVAGAVPSSCVCGGGALVVADNIYSFFLALLPCPSPIFFQLIHFWSGNPGVSVQGKCLVLLLIYYYYSFIIISYYQLQHYMHHNTIIKHVVLHSTYRPAPYHPCLPLNQGICGAVPLGCSSCSGFPCP